MSNEDKQIDEILNEDCLETMARMPDNFIDLTVTSPPYDNLRTYNGFEFDWHTVIEELYRVTKEGGVVVWVVGDATIKGSESGTSFRQALYFKEIGFNLHDTMIWKKQTFTDTGSLRVRYGGVFEYMFVFSKGKAKTFNPLKDRENKTSGRVKSGTVRQPDGTTKPISSKGKTYPRFGQRFNVWDINTEVSNLKRKHPAQFPEQLAHDHIVSWSNEGDIVYDPFMGSGTTAKVAKQIDRHYIGSEISEEYCKIAEKRLKQSEGEGDD